MATIKTDSGRDHLPKDEVLPTKRKILEKLIPKVKALEDEQRKKPVEVLADMRRTRRETY